MIIDKKYESISLPQVYPSGETMLFLDRIRKRLVQITPEEEVRQKTVSFLQSYLKVPSEYIVVEQHLSHYGFTASERADIVIEAVDEEGYCYPLAIVECKSTQVGISDQTLEQVIGYCDIVGAKYAFICDGIYLEGYCYCSEEECYKKLSKLPSYKKMLSDEHVWQIDEIINNEILVFDDLLEPFENEYEFIGEDTPVEYYPYIRMLVNALTDCTHKIRYNEDSDLSIIEDLGLSYRKYNDASDGNFGTGIYRMLLTSDDKGQSTIYGFSVISTGKTVNDTKYGNSSGKSVLVVSVSGNRKDKTLVQINLNEFLSLKDDCFTISHNGKFSTQGANKNEFIGMVQSIYPDMVIGNTVCLGILELNKLLTLESKSMVSLICNLIKYSSLIEIYKNSLRDKRKNLISI